MDKFYEQFITKDYGAAPKIMSALFYISLFLVAFSISLFVFLGFISVYITIFFSILSICIFIISNSIFIEYEYEYFEGEITISKIINKKSRKIIATFDIGQISKAYILNQKDNSLKYIQACIKNIPNNKEIIVSVSENNNQPISYYLSIDEKFLEILKKQKPNIFNYI